MAAFTPETFALNLGISPAAGAQLIADALDLRHRLPLLWKRLTRLQVPAWQARRVAQQTHTLPLAGARWVDQRLAMRTDGSLGPVIMDRLVARPSPSTTPKTNRTRKQRPADSDVKISHPHPNRLRRHQRPERHRRHPDPQSFHDLLAPSPTSSGSTATPTPSASARSKPSASSPPSPPARPPSTSRPCSGPPPPSTGKIRLYVLVDAADLDLDAEGGPRSPSARVEQLGAATIAKLRQWVGHPKSSSNRS